jgi:hypothetical protein
MPAEPERDMEKTLKAYAERRRQQAGAPLELHPATRRMLQGEAARRHSRKAKDTGFWSQVAGLIRRRLVLVTALTAMVVAITLTIVPALTRAKREQMASYRALDGASRKEPSPAPSAGELAKTKTSDQSLADKKVASDGLATTTPAEAPVIALDRSAATGSEKLKDIANPAQNFPATSAAEPLPAGRADTAKIATLAQNAVATPNSSLQGGVGGRTFGQASSLAPAAPAPAGASGLANQGAEAFQRNVQPTSAFAFKSEASSVQNLQDNLKLGAPVASSPPPVSLAAQAPPAAAPSGAVVAPAFANSDSDSAGAVTQRFYRLTASARKASTGTSSRNRGVLDSFRVEQSGGTMRVIDGDGSVYAGFVQVSDQPSQHYLDSRVTVAQEAESAQPQAAAKAVTVQPADALSGLPPSASYFFRVTGTNRTSSQPVVFSGTLTPFATQATGVRTGAQSRAVGGLVPAAQSAAPASGALPLSHAQLRGRALIGGTNAFDVNAAPSTQ